MADQNITALPVAASPASSDQLLLVGATEEKLIDYDKLADAILQKLTSKTFTLDQGVMTLLKALNELNSNSLTHAKRITINPSDGKSIILDDASSYLICYAGIDTDNIRNAGFAVALSRTSKEKTGGILSIKSELTGTNFALDGNTLKVSTNVWIVMTLTKI